MVKAGRISTMQGSINTRLHGVVRVPAGNIKLHQLVFVLDRSSITYFVILSLCVVVKDDHLCIYIAEVALVIVSMLMTSYSTHDITKNLW